MTTTLTGTDADQLAKLCGMFGSDHIGERAAAAAKADALIRARGFTWFDVFATETAPPSTSRTDWQRMARWCQAHHQKLNSREIEFVRTMLRWHRKPSKNGWRWLIDLYVRTGGTQR